MNYLRKILNIDVLADIMDIPKSFKHKKVEVLISPVGKSKEDIGYKFNPALYKGIIKIGKKKVNKDLKDLRSEWDRK